MEGLMSGNAMDVQDAQGLARVNEAIKSSDLRLYCLRRKICHMIADFRHQVEQEALKAGYGDLDDADIVMKIVEGQGDCYSVSFLLSSGFDGEAPA